jgi:hypothetical protein
MAWSSLTERETENDAIRRKYNDEIFGPSGRPTPRYLDSDNPDQYRKRCMEAARSLVSEELQKVRTQDLYGSALDHYEGEYFKSAKSEAQRPTNIPEGQLKEVVDYDAAGRPSYTYHGSPKVWMSDLAMPKKRLAGILDNRKWQKV